MIKLLCDTNMPLARTLFGTLGNVSLVDSSRLTREMLKDIDILIVRDTPINADLLEGTAVKFVGTAVTGTDHVDKAWMEQAGINWLNVPRANGISVADYCLAALLEYGHMRHVTLEGKTAAIIGVGWIGNMVRRRCEALGMRTICCDPPRQRNLHDGDAQEFVTCQEAIAEADFIIPFVPLTDEGHDPTRGLFNKEMLAQAKFGAVFVNMARGAICDTQAMIEALRTGRLSDAILDVWENEPDFSVQLAELAFLATPHLAGQAYEGKVNGTISLYHAACALLHKEPGLLPILPPPVVPRMAIDARGKTEEEVLWYITQKISMIVADHLRFSDTFALPEVSRRRAFTTLRRTYPYRRQFSATTIELEHASPSLVTKLSALGFMIA